MAKYVFQFEDEIDSKRPCRLVSRSGVLVHGFERICAAVNATCDGKLYDRPEWCPLTVIHENEKPDDR